MVSRYNLTCLDWRLAGFTPNFWLAVLGEQELTDSYIAEVASISAQVPGSVQQALLAAGRISDWNMGLAALDCEWVEHRHWVYEVELPTDWLGEGKHFQLDCLGLDYSGWLYVDANLVGEFRGGHAPCVFDLTSHLQPGSKLRLIFAMPPQWLGYTGFTSTFTDWKARFSYSWDWMVRLVTVGIWDELWLEVSDGQGLVTLDYSATLEPDGCAGALRITGALDAEEGATVTVSLSGETGLLCSASLPAADFAATGISWHNLPVALWWPNGQGAQPLYTVECLLLAADGTEQDRLSRRVGFRSFDWASCEGAPAEATDWLSVVNGRPVFLQGINWTPIRPNFHDLTGDDYRHILTIYRDMGINCLRVWGGGLLEKTAFYDLCDELGLMVWQEFPLSSSTFENWPPEAPEAIAEIAALAETWVTRRRHHACLLLWCGGNELSRIDDSSGTRKRYAPDLSHPLIAALAEVVGRLDPGRRFMPTSPYGPEFYDDPACFDAWPHWDVHGPWRPDKGLAAWEEFWARDDSLLRSEVGSPGASPLALVEEYCAPDAFIRPGGEVPAFRRQFDSWWWMEWATFEQELGRSPADKAEFIAWSQARQAEALSMAARACKKRFPRCGGIILWMGHDCFPCSSNTSIIDFLGNPKPAVAALARIFREGTTLESK